jgi:hypothetical protein
LGLRLFLLLPLFQPHPRASAVLAKKFTEPELLRQEVPVCVPQNTVQMLAGDAEELCNFRPLFCP